MQAPLCGLILTRARGACPQAAKARERMRQLLEQRRNAECTFRPRVNAALRRARVATVLLEGSMDGSLSTDSDDESSAISYYLGGSTVSMD
jgi:hypothetical protein